MRIRGVGGYVSRNARLGNVEATSFQTASGAAVDTAYKSPFFYSRLYWSRLLRPQPFGARLLL